MAFRLNDDLSSAAGGDDPSREISRLKEQLLHGPPMERQTALQRLIELRAEEALAECLSIDNHFVAQLATAGLWECWLNEQGEEARRVMDKGIQLMKGGRLEEALEIFRKLAARYPAWAEAHNKQATVLYLLGNARLSLKLCQTVVELKPNHFGAWNGIALCAAQLEKWQLALDAARKALSLQPTAQANHDLIQIAQAKLAEGA